MKLRRLRRLLSGRTGEASQQSDCLSNLAPELVKNQQPEIPLLQPMIVRNMLRFVRALVALDRSQSAYDTKNRGCEMQSKLFQRRQRGFGSVISAHAVCTATGWS